MAQQLCRLGMCKIGNDEITKNEITVENIVMDFRSPWKIRLRNGVGYNVYGMVDALQILALLITLMRVLGCTVHWQ